MDKIQKIGKYSNYTIYEVVNTLASEEVIDLSKPIEWQVFFQRSNAVLKRFLEDEITRTIQFLEKFDGATMLKEMMLTFTKENVGDSYAISYLHFFIDKVLVKEGLAKLYLTKLKSLEIPDKPDVFRIHLLHIFRINRYREDIESLPLLSICINVFARLSYLDKLNFYIESIKNDRPISRHVSNENKILKDIYAVFETMHSNGWSYSFYELSDFEEYCDLLVLFFQNVELEIPNHVIRQKERTATLVAQTLKEIYQNNNFKKLKSNERYFDLIRILSTFEQLSHEKNYNLMTKN